MASKNRYRKTRAILVERFPSCFAPKDGQKRPLKIGIYRDLRNACPDLPKNKIVNFLACYTRGYNYLRAVAAGESRVDLQGNVTEPMSTKHGAWARQVLVQRAKAVRQALEATDA
jgi:sRNA-binding protein